MSDTAESIPQNMEDATLDREDIQSEKVSDLSAPSLIRLFTCRLATYNYRHDYSRSRCVGEVAKEFRDDYKVNILRVLDEWDYVHPDGVVWNMGPFPESTIRKFDPVFPESLEEGGSADFRSGDVLVLEDNPFVIIGADDTHLVGMNKSGEIGMHSLATARELFASDEYSPKLIRDGEVIRGVDDDE